MNQATVKYNKIVAKEGKFEGSTTTVQEDIVAMFSQGSKKRKFDASNEGSPPVKLPVPELPPFATHFQDKDGKKYKVGDSKTFNEKTFYFCDCPFHQNKVKWHTHTAQKCRT